MDLPLKPADYGEAIAVFRASVIGPLMHKVLLHGQLASELRQLSEMRFRPPGAKSTRCYQVPTLERWLYAYRAEGLNGLRPKRRSDRGYAQELSDELRTLLLEIRREHPAASVPLILRTLIDEGRLNEGCVSEPTVRRLYAAHGLQRCASKSAKHPDRVRLRWQVDEPGALWHGDVCHLTNCLVAGKSTTVRIHGLLDDASRYGIALEAHYTEREADMLGVMVDSLRRHGRPDALYLDNGATYRGSILQVVCARLGIGLLHARPYDPQARGKMERFWRTLREGCLDFIGEVSCLADINERMQAFLDKHYHRAPHAGMMGMSPSKVYAGRVIGKRAIDESALRDALTVRGRRRVSNDNVLSVNGTLWELAQGYLARKVVTVAYCFATPNEAPWVEQEGKKLQLQPLDPKKNSRRARPQKALPHTTVDMQSTDFDPMRALLQEVPRNEEEPTND